MPPYADLATWIYPLLCLGRLSELLATALVTASPTERCPAVSLPDRARLDAFTQSHVKWLLVRTPNTLKSDEHAHLTRLCDTNPALKRLYELVHGFRRVLRERQEAPLHTWIDDAPLSGIDELVSVPKECGANWTGWLLV